VLTKRSPYYIQFYITGRCPFRCRMCNIVETNSALREASLDDMRAIASNIRRIGGGIVLLTGGEPFVRQNLPDIVRAFLAEGLDVRLQTAGIATDEQLQAVYDAGARDINVSLDSLDEARQDYINAVPGSWHRAIDCLERISAIFGRKSAITSLGCVLSSFNFREIPSILEFATAIGWHLSLVPVHIAPAGKRLGFRSFDGDFLFSKEELPELEQVMGKLVRMKKAGALLFDSERYLKSAFSFLAGNPPTWRHKGVCDAPDLYFAVRPNGDMSVCCDHMLDPGPPSLLSPAFAADFRSGRIRARCKPVTTRCKGCHYGSYPEVTLSVRDPRAFAERVRLALSPGRSRIRMPAGHGDFFRIAGETRARSPGVYGPSATDRHSERVRQWSDPAARRAIQEADAERRRVEGRLRAAQDRSA